MEKWSLDIGVTFKLHNFCVERNVDVPSLSTEEIHTAEPVVKTNAVAGDEFELGTRAGCRTDLRTCPKREVLAAALEEMGFLRPAS